MTPVRLHLYDIHVELFSIILGNWPWHAFINLPLIPIGLILARTPLTSHILPIIPILLPWPNSAPVITHERIVLDHWSQPENTKQLQRIPFSPTSTWPPSPLIFGLLIVPFARSMYRRLFDRFSDWVLDTTPTPRVPVRRLVWALNDDAPFNIRIGANIDAGIDAGRAPAQQGQGLGQEAQQNQNNAEPAAGAAAAAEHTIRVSGSSLGRLIGGALIIPAVSNRMGALLFHLSKWSPLLRRILAIRPPLSNIPPVTPPLWRYSLTNDRQWREMGQFGRIALAVRFAFGAVWGGTRLWAECDPVW